MVAVVLTGALSYNCYSLLISAGASPAANRQINVISKKIPSSPTVTAVEATVYPNPHQGSFNLQISSSEESKAIIQIMTADGKLIISKDVSLQKGNFNIIKFKGIYQSILFYRVIINNKSLTGKIIGPN